MPLAFASIAAGASKIFAGLTFRLVLLGIIAAMFVNTYVDLRIPIPILPDIHWEGWKPKAQREANENKPLRVALKESEKSIDTLLAEQRREAAEAQARADALENSRREALRDAERLQRAARVSQGQIDALRALAGRTEASCPVPAEMLPLLEGL